MGSSVHANQFLSYPPNDYAASKSMPSTPTHVMMNGGVSLRNPSNQSVLVNYGTMNGGNVNQLTPTSPTLTTAGQHKKLNNYLD